jgi:hypothetical protein
MNRAWIPAGALAGVSVAGLIALGHITDSLGTPVTFNPSVAVTTPSASRASALPVSVDYGQRGSTKTAALQRGGRAAVTSTNSDAGLVGFKRAPSTQSNTAAPATTSIVTPPPAKKPKTVKRQTLITGATSGPNDDQGLAGSHSGGTAGLGEQSSKPASETP